MKKKRESEIILGIQWEMNSSAALMVNGEIISAVSEERFTNVKNDERYPINAINYVLKSNNITSKELTNVTFATKDWSPANILIRKYSKFSVSDFIYEQEKYWYPTIYQSKKLRKIDIFKKFLDIDQYPGRSFWKKIVQKLDKIDTDTFKNNKSIKILGNDVRKKIVSNHLKIDDNKITFADHSSTHAAYAYYSGSLNGKKALVLTLDAYGDKANNTVRVFNPQKKNYEKIISKSQSSIIARLYRYTTLVLNLKPDNHEYKVMGLAAYSKKEYTKKLFNELLNLQDVKGINFIFNKKPKDLYFFLQKISKGERFDNIAGAVQYYTEYLCKKFVRNAVNISKINNVCFAGGVAMNVKSNLVISKERKISRFYVPFAPDDNSLSIGACYITQKNNINKFNSNFKNKKISNPYIGLSSEMKNRDNYIFKIFKNKKYKIHKTQINNIASKLLSKGSVIGRCVGKSEFGSRALGNRSILAHPSMKNIKNKINEKIKNRDFWMPFAATVLEKYASKYFYLNSPKKDYQYMTNCVDTKKLGKICLSEAIHNYDETCRPQILLSNINPDYEDLINSFGKITGIYGILNTSLNIHGYPIVGDEFEAINIFKKTSLDGLILKDYFVEKIVK